MMFNSSEALYQALKFKNLAHQLRISQTSDAGEAWALGQDRSEPLVDNFEDRKVELMYIANREKYLQNEGPRNELLSTGENVITFQQSTDFWNKANGDILTRIRAELRTK